MEPVLESRVSFITKTVQLPFKHLKILILPYYRNKDYDSIIKEIEEKNINEKVLFIQSFEFMKHLTKFTILKSYHHYFNEQKFSCGNTIFR